MKQDAQCKELSFSTILPKAKFRHYLVAVPSKDQVVMVRAAYNDTLGSYKREFKQRLVGLFGYRRNGHYPSYKSADALTRIATILDGWRTNKRLGVDVFNQRDRQREHDEDQECMPQQNY